ncbi:MAG TPA: ankyrin repeat domain-containing protein [Nannocystaceae bacterium]|nr:ankyrin repeat domain-containing protein [Nannocystaceae bacterium]
MFALARAGEVERLGQRLSAAPELLVARDDEGRSLLTVALLAEQSAVARMLLARGYAPELAECAWLGDWPRFDALATAAPDVVDDDHPLGGTVMYAGARSGQGQELWRVYAVGAVADPPRTRRDTMSPLRAAFEVDALATAELSAATLLANGADPNARQPEGDSALHAAARRGSLELVEMLVRKGARVDAADARGRTPIAVATTREVVAMLRDHSAIARDHTASRCAFTADGGRYEPAALDDIAPIDQRAFVGMGHGGLAPLRDRLRAQPRLVHAVATTTELAIEASAHTGRRDNVAFLLEHGAPLSLPSAVVLGDRELVKRLLAAAPDRIHERGAHDFALLWYAVLGGGDLEMTQVLLAAGAEVERQHHLGTTALHFAALHDQPEVAELLLAHGADPNRVGRKFAAQGTTPLQLAIAADATRVADLLRARGARVDA